MVSFAEKTAELLPSKLDHSFRPAYCFGSALDIAAEGAEAVGGTSAYAGVSQSWLPPRVPNLVLDRCGTQFGTGRIHICGLCLAVLEKNCKSAGERAMFLQVTCLSLCLQAA